jgi:hypothetical protein
MPSEEFFNKPLLVTGLVRNVASVLEKNVIQLNQALSKFSEVHWLLIESDSSDKTIEVLSELSKKIPRFRFLCQGVLSERMPLRTERIAYCRNVYLDEINSNILYKNVDYVIVSDFDHNSVLINEEGILSCWQRSDWDVCTANQLGPYYDIWALRHHLWSSNDCWLQHRFLSQFNGNESSLLYACVFSKMIQLPVSMDWVQVDSAFGGLAIYRKTNMGFGRYIGLYENGLEVCEHVPFHLAIRNNQGRIYINPRMINTDFTDHSMPLKPPEM